MLRERVKELSHRLGLYVYQVEQLCGMGRGTIVKWDKHMPRSDNLRAVAEILGTTVEELLKD